MYSADDILSRFRAYDHAFGDLPHRICYAVKANSNLNVLRLLAEAGAGFDIVSGGELFRVLKAGGEAAKIVFSGVGKTQEEIEFALRERIHIFNCESEAELAQIDASPRADWRQKARVAFRVNPDVDAATHPYISTGMSEHKFGIDITEVETMYARAMQLAKCLVGGRELPYRLADSGHESVARSGRQDDRVGRPPPLWAVRFGIWIWAEGSACRTGRRDTAPEYLT